MGKVCRTSTEGVGRVNTIQSMMIPPQVNSLSLRSTHFEASYRPRRFLLSPSANATQDIRRVHVFNLQCLTRVTRQPSSNTLPSGVSTCLLIYLSWGPCRRVTHVNSLGSCHPYLARPGKLPTVETLGPLTSA